MPYKDKNKDREYRNKYNKEHKEYFKKYREEHRIRHRECENINRRKLRKVVLEHYGGNPPKCDCCGENYIEFLAIDHINGGGKKHRKIIGFAHIYEWLIKNNFPKGFRILCHNCNSALGYYGYCPHQKMSANNELLIKKQKNKWKVFHHDCDDCYNDLLGEFETLEKAVDFGNEWDREQLYPVEYGMRIIK